MRRQKTPAPPLPHSRPRLGRVGEYELTKRVGTGGMAEVFLAKARGANGFERNLVIKRMLPEFSRDAALVEMFVDEAHIAVALSHPNIGRVYELGRHDGTYFIAMEHIPGVDVARVARTAYEKRAPVPLAHACFVIARVCDALGYAHDKCDTFGTNLGIVHRDVTPSNILISAGGTVKLIDFGIAKAQRRRAKTLTGQLKGKPRYVAPEQVRYERPDHQADIFSVGVVLYELLTNQSMYGDESDKAILDHVGQLRVARKPSERRRGIPPELDRIVSKALEPNVERRYKTAHQLHDDLDRFMRRHKQRSSPRELSRWLSEFQAPPRRMSTNRHVISRRARSVPDHIPIFDPDSQLIVLNDREKGMGGNDG